MQKFEIARNCWYGNLLNDFPKMKQRNKKRRNRVIDWHSYKNGISLSSQRVLTLLLMRFFLTFVSMHVFVVFYLNTILSVKFDNLFQILPWPLWKWRGCRNAPDGYLLTPGNAGIQIINDLWLCYSLKYTKPVCKTNSARATEIFCSVAFI